MKRRLARELDFGQPIDPAHAGQHQQRQHQGMHRTANAHGVFIQPVKQYSLRKQIQVKQGGSSQPQAQWFDVPTRVIRDIGKQLLDQNQRQNWQGHGSVQHQAFGVTQQV